MCDMKELGAKDLSKNLHKNLQMKKLLKELKNQKAHFAIPEPDADFEKRMLRSLRQSPDWNRSTWRDLGKKIFNFDLSFELSFLRVTSMGFAALLIFVTLNSRFKESRGTPPQAVFANGTANSTLSKGSNPELASMLQRGGAAALQVWVRVNGDLAAQNTPQEAASSDLSPEDQKRIISELEKKWAPAL